MVIYRKRLLPVPGPRSPGVCIYAKMQLLLLEDKQEIDRSIRKALMLGAAGVLGQVRATSVLAHRGTVPFGSPSSPQVTKSSSFGRHVKKLVYETAEILEEGSSDL